MSTDSKEFVYTNKADQASDDEFIVVDTNVVTPPPPTFVGASLLNPPNNFIYTDKQDS